MLNSKPFEIGLCEVVSFATEDSDGSTDRKSFKLAQENWEKATYGFDDEQGDGLLSTKFDPVANRVYFSKADDDDGCTKDDDVVVSGNFCSKSFEMSIFDEIQLEQNDCATKKR